MVVTCRGSRCSTLMSVYMCVLVNPSGSRSSRRSALLLILICLAVNGRRARSTPDQSPYCMHDTRR